MRDNILLITDGFPFDDCERGFLETEFEELTRHFQMNVLANNTTGKITHPFPDDVPCYRYSFDKLKISQIFQLPLQLKYPETRQDVISCLGRAGAKKKFVAAIRTLIYSLHAEVLCRQMSEIFRERGADIVYTYWCTQATVAAIRLKKEYPNLKIVTRFHGFDLYQERTPENWQPFRPYIAQNADLLVFACKKGKEYFLQTWPGEWEKRSIVSYLGTRPMERIIPKNEDKLVLISCSNLIPLKRVDVIIRALALLPDETVVEWNHVGDGPERENLKKLAGEKFAQKGNIAWKFWGEVPHNQIEQIYLKVRPDVFLTTSSTEGGAPVSVQEAMAMGVPAIGTDVGGMAELIQDGVNGYLLPEDVSAQQVCDAIVRFARLKPVQRQAFSRAAVELWEKRFAARRCAAHFVEQMKGLEDGGKT